LGFQVGKFRNALLLNLYLRFRSGCSVVVTGADGVDIDLAMRANGVAGIVCNPANLMETRGQSNDTVRISGFECHTRRLASSETMSIQKF
jgi:hypothetical protein